MRTPQHTNRPTELAAIEAFVKRHGVKRIEAVDLKLYHDKTNADQFAKQSERAKRTFRRGKKRI